MDTELRLVTDGDDGLAQPDSLYERVKAMRRSWKPPIEEENDIVIINAWKVKEYVTPDEIPDTINQRCGGGHRIIKKRIVE